MRPFLALSVIAIGSVAHAGVSGSYYASGKLDSVQYDYKVTESDILRTPIWKADADVPPLSPRKAQQIAHREFDRLFGATKHRGWVINETTIADMGDGLHFAYIIEFEPRPPEEACLGCDYIRILVLMDGTVPTPVTTLIH